MAKRRRQRKPIDSRFLGSDDSDMIDPLRLGPLETAVLRHLWPDGQASVKEVHRALGKRRGISLNTVQSAMDRLYKKDLLRREKVSHAYIYAPAVSRAELGTRILEQAFAPLAGEPSALMSAVVDFADREGDEVLAELEALVAERRRQRSQGDEGSGD
jgi:predicted transcriptional regulator